MLESGRHFFQGFFKSVAISIITIDESGRLERIVHHLSQLVVVQGFSQLPCDPLETVEVHHSLALVVPELEDLGDAFPGLGVADLRTDDFQELVELDGSINISEASDHFEDDLAPALQAELFEHLFDFNWIDGSSLIFVEEIEGVFKFLIIVL